LGCCTLAFLKPVADGAIGIKLSGMPIASSGFYKRMTMALRKIFVLALIATGTPAIASTNFNQLNTLTQSEFAGLADDFTAAASYKAVSPAAALGITGFDLGMEFTSTRLKHADAWKKAGADVSQLPLAKLHVRKGLPFDIDVGASLTTVPDSDIKLWGAEAQYAFLPGSVTLPALSLRAAYSKLSGVSQLDLNTRSVELSVSKGFLNVTPYLGVGHVWGDVTPNFAGLQKISTSADKLFGGVNMNFGFVNVALEMDRTGKNESYSAKLGFRF
jgi:hypothetical protein